MEWQPIETAPKDGTRILLVTSSGRPRRIFMGSYTDKGSWWPWRVDQTNYHINQSDLTHWMPLPPPPAGQGG